MKALIAIISLLFSVEILSQDIKSGRGIHQGAYGLAGFLRSTLTLPFDLIRSEINEKKLGRIEHEQTKSEESEIFGILSNEKSCEERCPLDYSLLRLNSSQYEPNYENSLLHLNHDYSYPMGDYFGHCWGHATITQRLTRLAFFEPDEVAPYKKESREWVLFYKKIVRDIARNRARTVPEFKSIKEFSSHPLLADFFRRELSLIWFRNSSTWRGLIQTGKGSNSSRARIKYLEELKKRLERNETPLVVANYPIPIIGAFNDSHVLIAWKIYRDDNNNNVICYRDGNLAPHVNAACTAKDIISDSGELIQFWWIPHKSIAYHEDMDLMIQLKSIQRICMIKCVTK